MYNHQLDAFIKTAELGSFAKAAEAMYISSPAIIQQINLLETRCGFKLFIRSNHGIQLTPAGCSLYEDAKTLVRLSEQALDKAKFLANAGQNTVRVGTSLLFKCRLLTNLLPQIVARLPALKLEVLPLPEHTTRNQLFPLLGTTFDVFEGSYCSISWRGLCQFLELERTPICCAVSALHPLAQKKTVSFHDLDGERIVMPISGGSAEMDALRHDIIERLPSAQIIDSSYYGLDTFATCELNRYVLITEPRYADIHPNLVTLPLESSYTLPYGLMYANEPSEAVKKMLQTIQSLL